jgi:hypothetical protein
MPFASTIAPVAKDRLETLAQIVGYHQLMTKAGKFPTPSAGIRARQKKPPYVSTEVAGLSMKFGSKPAVPGSKEAS